MENHWILAQGDTTQSPPRISSQPAETESGTQVPSDGNGAGPKEEPPQGMGFLQLLFPILMVMLIFMMFRSPRRQQQKQQQMVAALEKNDRVRTIGGIIGTVIDVKDDEVVLKVDENNNTKIRIAASAVGKNLTKEK